MKAQDAWDLAYSQLELQLDRGSFDTWLRGATFLGVEAGVFVVGVRNTYARDMLQHRLYRNVWRILSDVWGEPVEVRFEVHQPVKDEPTKAAEMPLFRLLAEQGTGHQPAAQAQQTTIDEMGGSLHNLVRRPQKPDLPESELNPRFTFERFMVSNSNRMAYEAARSIADHPGRNYNPFLVYGGVGLGKTHLLNAIAHVCAVRGLRAIYIPSEVFTNDLISSIRQRTTAMFREKYRSADVLLVDDIQFLSGKDSTQEEFFHTFNALVTHNKQIVLASDRHPRELNMLEDRLRSRFQGGLVMDIPPLELEARMAILEMWAEEKQVHLPYGITQTIAEYAPASVRDLWGVFTQVTAKAHLSGEPLTLPAVERLLERHEAPRYHGRQITLDDVIATTAQHYRMKPNALTGKGRTQRVNQARQVAMFLARELTDASLPTIGDALGGRSHTTVLHGCNKVAELLGIDDSIGRDIDIIRRQITGC